MTPKAFTLLPCVKVTLFVALFRCLMQTSLMSLVAPEKSTFASTYAASTQTTSSFVPANHTISGHHGKNTSLQFLSTLQPNQTPKSPALASTASPGTDVTLHASPKATVNTLEKDSDSSLGLKTPLSAKPDEAVTTVGSTTVLLPTTNQGEVSHSVAQPTTTFGTKQILQSVTRQGSTTSVSQSVLQPTSAAQISPSATNQGATTDVLQSVALPTTAAETTHISAINQGATTYSSRSAAQTTPTLSVSSTIRDETVHMFSAVTQVSVPTTQATTVTATTRNGWISIKPPPTQPTTPATKSLSTMQPHFPQGTVTMLPPVTDSSTEREHTSKSHSVPSTVYDTEDVPRLTTKHPRDLETDMVLQPPDGYMMPPFLHCPSTGEGRLNETKGSITWVKNRQKCVHEHSWRIVVAEGYGIVVEFHKVDMQVGDSLDISVAWGNKKKKLRSFQYKRWDMSPLMIRERAMDVKVEIPDQFGPRSSFNLSYTAHPVHAVPTYRVVGKKTADTESRIIYQCGGIPDLPKAIICDGIHHCELGEDEVNCSQDQGCGSWFSFNDKCYKASFSLVSSKSSSTMPLQAEAGCREKHGATLATLQEPGAMNMAVRMIRNSGFGNAVVDIRKVKPVSQRLRHLYRFIWQWGDEGSPIAYEQEELQRTGVIYDCAILDVNPDYHLQPFPCALSRTKPDGYICMKPNRGHREVTPPLSGLVLTMESPPPEKFPVKECPDGSVVQTFHLCQWGLRKEDEEAGWSPNNLPLFQCRFGQTVHYTLLCDGNPDCADGSDELDCRHPQFSPLLRASFICRNLQAILVEKRCDGSLDCFDESDEKSCVSCGDQIMCPGVGCVPATYARLFKTCPPVSAFPKTDLFPYSPGTVILDGTGMSIIEPTARVVCREGFYPCRGGYCIPTFLLNNGEQDCPHGEDEDALMTNLTCPGYYRCQGVGNCVHPRYLCDGIYHCPKKDDEMFCHVPCPRDRGCVCEGHAFTCSGMIDPLQNLHVRYLDLSHARNVSLENIHVMEYLVFLNLSSCGLDNVTLTDMPQLQTLDLSNNLLTHLASLSVHQLPGLVYLDLSNNLFLKTIGDAFRTMLNIGKLHHLKTLIMTNVSLEVIGSKALSTLSHLQHLDIRLNPIRSYYKDSLFGLTALQEMYTDDSKLCCSYFHSSLPRCHAPVDELSSCSDLLGQDFFRVFLWSLSALALAGNAGVLIYRVFISKQKSVSSSQILVKNLCASDLLMGVYMMMIGVADAQFHGVYVAKEKEWTNSVACTAAGFLSFVSSEVSAFMICLITLERVLVICFPFKLRLHPSSRATVFACCVVWVIGISLAAVPLILRMEFYGQNGICIPLPITRHEFSGQIYAFNVFIVLNFVIFVLIGAGQVLIYRSVHNASRAAGCQRREQDLTIARRLFLIVLTDFCCWFPIGVMGLLAFRGVPIPGEVNVWAAIFVLPLNSALNPFLYTLNGLMEKWKNQRMEKRTRKMLGKLQIEIPKWKPGSVTELIRICVQSKVVEKDRMLKAMAVHSDSTSGMSSRSCSLCGSDVSHSTSCNVYEEINDVTV